MPLLSTDRSNFDREVDRLADLVKNLGSMEPRFQKLVAEVAMLRLFGLLETTLCSLTIKVLCGADYLDGTHPAPAVLSRSSTAAIQNMRQYGRATYHNDLRWTKASDIKNNVRFLMNTTENIVHVVDINGSLIDEMRRVRNRIAHNNSTSRKNFRVVVRRYYGAEFNAVTPGLLLLSPRHIPSLIEQYMTKAKVLIKNAVKA